MNRIEEVDKFLSKISNIKDLDVSTNTFYCHLLDYGLNNEEHDETFANSAAIRKKYFNKWKKEFNDYPIELHEIPGFLRFENHGDCLGGTENYKLYLSFPKDSIYEGVNKIINFVTENNIMIESKVADCLRSDSFVVRMYDEESVRKLLRFINTDEFFIKNCKKTNPFLIRAGVVGLGFDRDTSYNYVVSCLLTLYFAEKKNNSDIDTINYDDFNIYLKKLRRSIITDDKKLLEFFSNDDVKDIINVILRSDFNSVGDAIVNFIDVLNFIILSLDQRCNIEDYFDRMHIAEDAFKTRMIGSYFDRKYKNILYDEDNSSNNQILVRNDDIENVIDRYIFSGYDDTETIIKNLTRFLKYSIPTFGDKSINRSFKSSKNRKEFKAVLRYMYSDSIENYVNKRIMHFDIDNYKIFHDACIKIFDRNKSIYDVIDAILKIKIGDFDDFGLSAIELMDMDYSMVTFYVDELLVEILEWAADYPDIHKKSSKMIEDFYEDNYEKMSEIDELKTLTI